MVLPSLILVFSRFLCKSEMGRVSLSLYFLGFVVYGFSVKAQWSYAFIVYNFSLIFQNPVLIISPLVCSLCLLIWMHYLCLISFFRETLFFFFTLSPLSGYFDQLQVVCVSVAGCVSGCFEGLNSYSMYVRHSRLYQLLYCFCYEMSSYCMYQLFICISCNFADQLLYCLSL